MRSRRSTDGQLICRVTSPRNTTTIFTAYQKEPGDEVAICGHVLFSGEGQPARQHHSRVLACSQAHSPPLLTTELVLVELANSLAGSRFRPLVRDYFATIRRSATVVPVTRRRLEQALALYSQHEDKAWSLTDCYSFLVMRERGLTAALTGDHHFVQAGFEAVFV